MLLKVPIQGGSHLDVLTLALQIQPAVMKRQLLLSQFEKLLPLAEVEFRGTGAGFNTAASASPALIQPWHKPRCCSGVPAVAITESVFQGRFFHVHPPQKSGGDREEHCCERKDV